MMFIMTFNPPLYIQSNQQVTGDKTDNIIFSGALKYLTMSGSMSKQSQVRGNDGEKGGVEELKAKGLYEEADANAYAEQ
jgi:hypothetical protein